MFQKQTRFFQIFKRRLQHIPPSKFLWSEKRPIWQLSRVQKCPKLVTDHKSPVNWALWLNVALDRELRGNRGFSNLRNLTGRAENLTAEHRVEESDVQSTESWTLVSAAATLGNGTFSPMESDSCSARETPPCASLCLSCCLEINLSPSLPCWIAGPLFYIPVMLSIEADPESFDLSLSSILSKASGSVWYLWKNSAHMTLAWGASLIPRQKWPGGDNSFANMFEWTRRC